VLFYLLFLGELIAFQNLAGHEASLEPYVVADLVTLGAILVFGWSIRHQMVGLFRLPAMDKVSWSLLLLGTPLAWLVNQGILWMSSGLPTTIDIDIFADLEAAGASALAIFVLTCVTPPLLEEVAFRGIILEAIREPFGTWPAVVVVSVLFSILHLAILSFLPFAGLAIVFGALRIRTGSLWPPVVGHALFNIASWQMWSQ
jgi:membrane protease YdiL (CAAX protease family)